MTANPKHFFTLEEYFALERVGDARYEYWDGDIVCMSGGSQEHADIGDNVFALLKNQLRGRRCRAMTDATAVKTVLSLPYKYPDVIVTCGQREFEKVQGISVLLNPTLIIEVLSPTTAKVDKEAKFTIYKAIDTFREYLLIDQDQARITQFVKQENGEWTSNEVNGLDNSIYLPSIDCTLLLAEVYEDVFS